MTSNDVLYVLCVLAALYVATQCLNYYETHWLRTAQAVDVRDDLTNSTLLGEADLEAYLSDDVPVEILPNGDVRQIRSMTPTNGTRYYGGNGTIHGSTTLDVEVRGGKVVAVWFRCCPLPFRQTHVDVFRADEMKQMYARQDAIPQMDGVTIFNG